MLSLYNFISHYSLNSLNFFLISFELSKNLQEFFQNSQIIKYIIYLTPVAGLASLMYDLGAKRCMDVFQTAVKKKTGVRFTYDYILNNNSISLNKIENGRIT